jgi:hypothetical protein
MNIPVSVKMPDLWGDVEFSKTEWGGLNYLVGPNGSGKTRFAVQLKACLSREGMKPRHLSAERLSGLEKSSETLGQSGALRRGFDIGRFSNYRSWSLEQGLAADAFIILKQKIDVRIRVEAFLSSIFGRRIRFDEFGKAAWPTSAVTFGPPEVFGNLNWPT